MKDKPIWRFGIVRIELDETKYKSSRSNIQTVGLWIDQEGSGIGYNSTEKLSLSDSCRLVVIVKNEEQLDTVKQFFEDSGISGEDGLCLEKE